MGVAPPKGSDNPASTRRLCAPLYEAFINFSDGHARSRLDWCASEEGRRRGEACVTCGAFDVDDLMGWCWRRREKEIKGGRRRECVLGITGGNDW